MAHSTVVVLMLSCVSFALTRGLSGLAWQAVLAYLAACFCGEIYTRFVDGSTMVLPLSFIVKGLLPFEAVQIFRRLFPAVLAFAVLLTDAFAVNRLKSVFCIITVNINFQGFADDPSGQIPDEVQHRPLCRA